MSRKDTKENHRNIKHQWNIWVFSFFDYMLLKIIVGLYIWISVVLLSEATVQSLSRRFLPPLHPGLVTSGCSPFLSIRILAASVFRMMASVHCIYQAVSSLQPIRSLNICPSPHVRAEGGRRHGYMGHLTRIANCIVHSTDKGPNSALVQQLIKGKWSMEF